MFWHKKILLEKCVNKTTWTRKWRIKYPVNSHSDESPVHPRPNIGKIMMNQRASIFEFSTSVRCTKRRFSSQACVSTYGGSKSQLALCVNLKYYKINRRYAESKIKKNDKVLKIDHQISFVTLAIQPFLMVPCSPKCNLSHFFQIVLSKTSRLFVYCTH